MYITKHLPYMPFEIWAIIFKKVQLWGNDYHLMFIYPQLCKEKDERTRERIKALKARRMKAANCGLWGGYIAPCREYNLSKKTYRAYYSKERHKPGMTGCPYLYMDEKHNVKQCQWDKLGKEIKSYKLPRFVLDY
jgi:hypothetical protein